MKMYRCLRCGATGSFYVFRGASEDSQYLKCYRCGSMNIVSYEEDEEI